MTWKEAYIFAAVFLLAVALAVVIAWGLFMAGSWFSDSVWPSIPAEWQQRITVVAVVVAIFNIIAAMFKLDCQR